ncbi:hypothetical protein [Pandoraea sp.]|uniref:hypothetical protein n=1 Tax=Pandoraea sp. TaxID=1883445 RepID=UPI0035AFD69A
MRRRMVSRRKVDGGQMSERANLLGDIDMPATRFQRLQDAHTLGHCATTCQRLIDALQIANLWNEANSVPVDRA